MPIPKPFISRRQVIIFVRHLEMKCGLAHNLVGIRPAQPAHFPGAQVPLALPGVQLDNDVTDGVLPALRDGVLGHLVLGQADRAQAGF